MPRDMDDRVQRAHARQLLGPMQESRTSCAFSSNRTAQSEWPDSPHGQKEIVVTDDKKSPPGKGTRPRKRWVLGTTMFVLGAVCGGLTTFGVVYYHEWWADKWELVSTNWTILVYAAAGVLLAYIVLYKGALRYRRRVIRKKAEHEHLLGLLEDTQHQLEVLQRGGATTPYAVPAPVAVVPRAAPTPRPVPIRTAEDVPSPAGSRRLRGNMGVDRTTVGNPPPPDLLDDDDDDFDVPSFLRKGSS